MPLPTRKQVIETLFAKWQPVDLVETIATEEALGRVLTHNYHALYSIPVVRASAMDGVAVISERFANGIPDTGQWVIGVDYCRADTGDDFDDRFDAVIPIEKVIVSETGLQIDPGVRVTKNMNIRPSGSMIMKGTTVGQAGRRLCSFDLACLAMGGIAQVEVYKKPRVAFLPTGSELVPLGTAVTRGENIDSNSVLVKNMLLEMGAEPIMYPIVKDDRQQLDSTLDRALAQADVVILSGGSSKGEEDFNARILEERGVALFHWVAAAPGKPMCVSIIENKPVINIPGPPIAMLYGMEWCIRAIVHHLLHIPMLKRQAIIGTLTEDIQAPPSMEVLCMMDVQNTPEGYRVKQKPWRNGSMVEGLSAGALYITELGVEVKRAGEMLPVYLLRGEEYFDA